MFMKTENQILKTAKYLFSLFKVFFLEQQHRAGECTILQRLATKMRQLPSKCPQGNRWTKQDLDSYKPIDNEIVSMITKELKPTDIMNTEEWITNSTILVTSNIDKSILNTCMAKILSRKNNTILIKWRKKLQDNIYEPIQELLYNEDKYPQLFSYFYKGAPAQILDNSNANVNLGVANGTRCWYHSLGWDDNKKTISAINLISDALRKKITTITLDEPPDFINVELADRNGNRLDPKKWLLGINLCKTNETVIIPIGLMNIRSNLIKIKTDDDNTLTIYYQQHAVDLAMALTVWKSQGSTLNKIILLLEGSPNSPVWQYEHIYVGITRVRSSDDIRCFPLSLLYNENKLSNLRPNIFTTKWRMNIDDKGKFKSN